MGGAPQAGGAWSGPSAVVGGNYDPATMTAGVYTYTVTGVAPCANASATVTVTENAATNAGTNGSLTLCSNGVSVALSTGLGAAPQAGGAWSGPSAVVGGNYDPATMTAGVYTYTVTGVAPCANASATVTVTENAATNAGTNGSLTLCSNGVSVALSTGLGAAPQAGGAWSGPSAVVGGNYDPATMTAGVYTYTVTGVAPCANASATVTVTENAATNAGTNGSLTICDNGAASTLFTQLGSAPQAGGAWSGPSAVVGGNYDPATMTAGVYTYTVTGVAPCANASATVTVTENTAPNAGADASTSICDQGLATNLLPLLVGAQAGGTWTGPGGGAFSGSYDPATNASGNYTYTVAGIVPCAADQAVVTVTETSSPNAGTNGTLTLCANSASTNLFLSLGGGAQAGGTWATPGGAAHSATIDPAVDAAGIYVYTLNATAPCVSDQSQVNVVINTAPNAGADASTSICDQGLATNLLPLLVGAQAGGTWTAPGGGAFSGSYDPATNASGNYTYTVAGTLPCAAIRRWLR
ncbi:MAG: hypothetical protein IPO90_00165 [Flavobacteriales bacterium]|nr:hypothetical protein [Flavobacteriales bacterium]